MKKLILVIIPFTLFTSCLYKTPGCNSYGNSPTTNNPDIIRKRAASQVMPGVGY